jgi:hypothetical protein
MLFSVSYYPLDKLYIAIFCLFLASCSPVEGNKTPQPTGSVQSIQSPTLAPKLFYSDLLDAPNSGWSTTEPSKGALVTIWGNHFGQTRGSSFVTVNGVALRSDADYATWGAYKPTAEKQAIRFWLNNSMNSGTGNITVTVNGVTSNALPFTIRSGNIFFVSPANPGGTGSLNNPYELNSTMLTNIQAGDIYYFRSGVYDKKVNGGPADLWMRSTQGNGAPGNRTALIGYPNETPVFRIYVYNVNLHTNLKLSNQYMVVSNLTFDSAYQAVEVQGNNLRFVGNDLIGLTSKAGSGTGIIVVQGNANKLLGNYVHGGMSHWRYDHAIYVSGCAQNEGNELAWNNVSGNDFAEGPNIVVNHQANRCGLGQYLKAHFIHDNIVDCTAFRSKAIGIYDLSWDPRDIGEQQPEPTYVYNNLLVGCGNNDVSIPHSRWIPVISVSNGKAYIFNNTIYNARYAGVSVKGFYDSWGPNPGITRIISVTIANNIIHMNSDISATLGGDKYISINAADKGVVSIQNNIMYGVGLGGAYVPCVACLMDQNNVETNPLFTNAIAGNFYLQPQSLGVHNGAFLTLPASFTRNNVDVDLNQRSLGQVDIGAFGVKK